ncbi:MAG: AzlC family ABC transporter permease [Treponema sp.]|nr:AzlC family ABC transporter permease [Treponema sp.]
MSKKHFVKALKITLPVFFGYIAIGIPFGLMLVNAGYPAWLAPVMSVSMYAGAGQYVAIGLFASKMPLGAIIVTELFVNIRHIVYGLSLLEKFSGVGKWKPYLIFALTDETYSLMVNCDVPENYNAGTFYGTIAFLDHIYWITGGIIGAIAGTLLPFSFKGVDFALTALFIVLLIEQLEKSKDFLPPLIGSCSTIMAIALFKKNVLLESNILILAISMSIAFLIILRKDKNHDARELKMKESTVGANGDVGAGGDANTISATTKGENFR